MFQIHEYIFVGEATEKNNDGVVDRRIHGNYDDKMILPDAGKVPHPTPYPTTPPLGRVTTIIIQLATQTLVG